MKASSIAISSLLVLASSIRAAPRPYRVRLNVSAVSPSVYFSGLIKFQTSRESEGHEGDSKGASVATVTIFSDLPEVGIFSHRFHIN